MSNPRDEFGGVTDFLMMLLVIAAFAGAAGYVWACIDLTEVKAPRGDSDS